MKKYQHIKTMKRILLIIAIAVPFLSFAQSTVNPDDTPWRDGNNRTWYQSGLGTDFINYNGVIHVFNYQDNGIRNGGHTYMYTINKEHNLGSSKTAMADFKLGSSNDHNNKIVWGYGGEGSAYDEGRPLGRFFAFLFNGRLWHYQHIRSADQGEHDLNPKNESYECYAEVPIDTMQKCFTYYSTHSPVLTQLKLGGFQLDSMMYFVSRYSDGNLQWMIQEYSYSSSDNKFHYVKNIMLTNIPTSYTMLGGLVKRIDANGKEYMILNMFNESTYVKVIGKLTPGIGSDNKRTFTWTQLFDSNAIFSTVTTATTIAEGSMKACRTSDPNSTSPDRLVVFGLNKDKCSDGYYRISFREFRFENDVMIAGTYGTLDPAKSSAPSKGGDHFQLLATFDLQPHHYGDAIEGTNGYQQYIWVLYPDGNKHFNGLPLQSDLWRMTNDLIITSDDLWNDELYPGINKLWSLIGIIDGAPPASINWELWNEHYFAGTDPTELKFTVSGEHESEVTSTYEDQWSVGESMELDVKHVLSLSEEFKYSQTFKSTVSNSVSVKRTLSKTFGLLEENQDSAVMLWSVPTIKRYTYATFPWWDTQLTNPIPNSKQYLFRPFGIAVVDRNVPIEDYPYLIEAPNASNLQDWSMSSRADMEAEISNHGLQPIMDLTWIDTQVGDDGSYEITNNSSDSYEQTTEWEINASVGVAVPKIFKASGSAGYKVSYSTETKVTTSYGTQIDASLANLRLAAWGPSTNSLEVKIYWFKNSKNPSWWFYSEFGDQRPWYIAYFAGLTNGKINLLTPENGISAENANLFFSWETDNASLKDYTLVIATESPIQNENIVFRQPIGSEKGFALSGFKPEPGKTYYWSVIGVTDEKEIVYSPAYTFTVNESGLENTSQGLAAYVYPNPGKSSDIRIAVNGNNGGTYTFTLMNASGVVFVNQEIKNEEGLPLNISFPDAELAKGVYFAIIKNDDEQVTRKVIVR